MPVTWSVSERGDFLTVTGSGVVTEPEYLGAHAGIFAATAGQGHPRLTLCDWTGVTEIQLESSVLRRSTGLLREQFGSRLDEHRMALVAASQVVYGLCRMWQLLIEESGLHCAVFRDIDEARKWLLERQ